MIIIDAGHGGTDPGAISPEITEKDYTLKISNYMYDRFNQLGIPTFITRQDDITLSPSNRINTIKPYVKSSDDIVISNHLNAGGAGISNYEGLLYISFHNRFLDHHSIVFCSVCNNILDCLCRSHIHQSLFLLFHIYPMFQGQAYHNEFLSFFCHI